MSFLNEYALAQYRAAQRSDPTIPPPGTHDWRTLAELADAHRVTRRADWGRRPRRSLGGRLRRLLPAALRALPRRLTLRSAGSGRAPEAAPQSRATSRPACAASSATPARTRPC